MFQHGHRSFHLCSFATSFDMTVRCNFSAPCSLKHYITYFIHLLTSKFLYLLSFTHHKAQSVTNHTVVTPNIYPFEIRSQNSDYALRQRVSTMHCQIVMPKLEALLPGPMFRVYPSGSFEAGLTAECASGAYFDLLSFSLTNNFAGLDGFPPQHVLGYLKSQSSAHVDRLMQSISGQTGRALAEKLFICAVEAKDSSLVEIILRHNQNTKVDANRSVLRCNGTRYTSIERSAGLRDMETIRVLLAHGADPNKTFSNATGFRIGALACALEWDPQDKTPVEIGLVRLLLEHGTQVQRHHLDTALMKARSEVVNAVFQAGARKYHAEWAYDGHFSRVMRVLDDEAATESIKFLKKIGANIDAPQRGDDLTMLDMAAKRGNFEMVLMLLNFGAIGREATLSYAIQGRNRAVVDLFLNEVAADISSRKIRTTPYAEAIRIGDERLMRILEQKDPWDNIKEGYRYAAAMDAASEVGNVNLVRHLLKALSKTPNKYQPEEALATAVESNNEEITLLLLHAGVRNFWSRPANQPLGKALENRNAVIVRALLNFGTETEQLNNRSLVVAAEWGDISIMEDLLVAGCPINPESGDLTNPLIVAIGKQNWESIHFLLNAGSDVNAVHRNAKKGLRTALSAAVKIQDINIVNYLLSVGADPGDPAALLESCERGSEFLRLLLEVFMNRYPNGKRGYFDDALADAVRRDDIFILKKLRSVMVLKFPGYSQHVGSLIGTRLIASNDVSLRAVRMLLDSGANPDAVIWSRSETRRITVLSAAIEAGNCQMVQLLLDKGADINFPATRGITFTPIQAAAKTGCYEIVLTLINRGANVDASAADAEGGTAVQLAAIGGFVGIVELLLQKGANVNRSPSILHGRTALEGAAEWGRLDMVQFLLQSGAQIDGRGRNSFLNAMKLAEKNGHFVVLESLRWYLS